MRHQTLSEIERIGLRRPDLLRNKALIAGEWVDEDRKEIFPVKNPANDRVICNVPNMGASEAIRAVKAAEAAFAGWRARTAKERANLLRAWFDLIMDNSDDLARLMTAEQGKPLAESLGEISYAASFIEWFAEEAARLTGIQATKYAFDEVAEDLVDHVSAANSYRRPNGIDEAAFCDYLVNEFEQRIEQLGPDNVAAHCRAHHGRRGCHGRARRLLRTNACGVLYIADEVVTAFGSLGEWSASQALYGYTPDTWSSRRGSPQATSRSARQSSRRELFRKI